MKSVVLHIGANKTGSSAIQEFLRLNVEALARACVHVAPADLLPEGKISGQHIWLVEDALTNPREGARRIAEQIDRLMTPLDDSARLLISAENLSNGKGAEALFAEVAARHNTRVVLYIRRQDELLLSSWQQWESKVDADFWAWLVDCVGLRGDWRGVLQDWERIVPRTRITVRIFDRESLPDGDVIADFAQVLGLADRLPEFARPEAPVNPSFTEAVVDFAKGNPLLFRDKHDNAFYDTVSQLTGDRYRRNSRESVISHAQRCAILRHYAESNEWVRQAYFPNSRPPLFTPPKPEDYEALSGDTLELQKWELLGSLVFGLARRVLD